MSAPQAWAFVEAGAVRLRADGPEPTPEWTATQLDPGPQPGIWLPCPPEAGEDWAHDGRAFIPPPTVALREIPAAKFVYLFQPAEYAALLAVPEFLMVRDAILGAGVARMDAPELADALSAGVKARALTAKRVRQLLAS